MSGNDPSEGGRYCIGWLGSSKSNEFGAIAMKVQCGYPATQTVGSLRLCDRCAAKDLAAAEADAMWSHTSGVNP